MIQALIFDYGGVVTEGGGRNELPSRLSEKLGISVDESRTLLWSAWGGFAKGLISEDKFWHIIEENYGKPITQENRQIWHPWDRMRPSPIIIDLLTRLKADDYKLGLLSNTIANSAEDIRANGGYDLFDFTVLSYETGFAKPQKEIYELALSHLPELQPEETVFIDDQHKCLVPAEKLGMHTILAENPQQIVDDVNALLADRL